MPRQKPKSFYFTLGNFLRTLSERKSAALRQFHAREVLFYSVLRVFIGNFRAVCAHAEIRFMRHYFCKTNINKALLCAREALFCTESAIFSGFSGCYFACAPTFFLPRRDCAEAAFKQILYKSPRGSIASDSSDTAAHSLTPSAVSPNASAAAGI